MSAQRQPPNYELAVQVATLALLIVAAALNCGTYYALGAVEHARAHRAQHLNLAPPR